MTIEVTTLPDPRITCESCEACCCRLEVMLITDTGVPDRFIATDGWGGRSMARLGDGWCAALDRNTLRCMIYNDRPGVCRDLEVGSYECIAERDADPRVGNDSSKS